MTFIRTACAAAVVIALGQPALALEAKKQIKIDAKLDAVWKVIGDFCGIGEWHPAVEKCELSTKDGAQYRTLSLKGGGVVLEKLIEWNDTKSKYTYTIEDGPLPVSDYQSTFDAKEKDGKTVIVWKGTFLAKGETDVKAIEVMEGIYEAGLKGIKKKVKG